MRFMENLVLVFIYIGIGLLLYGGTLVHSAGSFPCDPSTGLSSFPFCDTSLTIADRAKDLVGRLTLQEKVQQLVSGASAITRLGIPKYEWWSEALHGVSNVGPGTQFGAAVPGSTSFPQVILTAASFNASLWEAIGRVASTEARGMYNAGVAGLTYWSPNVNLFSDPRWGRGQETPGEDPTVVGKYATSYVRGLQGTDGSDPNRLKVAACCKHYTAYEVDNWKGIQRFTFNAIVTAQDLEDSYNPPFKSCVLDGNVASVMCSYNQVNGVPTCADKNLLAGTIRGQWNLNGYIVSDCDSVSVFYNQQHYAATPEDAAADAINAGLDMDCGSFLGQYTGSAVNESKVNESAVDQALFNTFTVLMRLGRFDGDPAKQPYGNLGPNDVCTDEHQQLALEAAKQGIVLLKNDGALPLLTNNVHSLAVIGPNANVTKTMIGNYAGIPCKYTTPLEGLSLYTQTVYAPGCANVACNGNDSLLAGAVQTASNADATVLIIGGDQSLEAEALDRTSLLLPGQQQQLVSQVTAASKGSVVLVIMSGGPFDITFAKDDAKISGILWVGYPGQAGGAAIADVIFGAYNPGGKLPVTWYPEDFAVNVPMTNMNMRPDNATGYPGRTYRFYIGKTVYAFGYGLSYTTFSHSLVHAPEHISLPLDACSQMKSNSCEFLSVTHTNCEDLSMEIHVDVKNVGPRDGGHVLFLFSTPPSNDIDAPQKQLISFRKVHVQAGALKRVQFTLAVCKDLSVVDKSGTRMLPVGSHLLHIGDLQHSVSLQISSCDSHKGNMVLSFRKLIRTDKMAQTWTLCIQVSCYPNSGQGNFEYVLKDNALNKVVQKRREIHGVTTNNEAYYLALIEGLKTAKIYGANNVSVFTNSELLCNQMKGAYQVRKSNLKPLHREARAIVSQFHFFTISHHSDIKRMSNGLLCGKISSLGEGVKTEMASTYVPSKIIDGRCYTSLLCVCFFLIIVLVSLMVWDFL